MNALGERRLASARQHVAALGDSDRVTPFLSVAHNRGKATWAECGEVIGVSAATVARRVSRWHDRLSAGVGE